MPEQNLSQEQLKALQEKISQMSPEELKEFQKKQCIFCQIIAGKIQARKVYEDERAVAILDINPANPGHILLLTKEHYSIMPQVPDNEISRIFMAAKSLSNSMLRSIDAQGTNIIVANGVAAGQRAQHFMVHIIPRKEKDGINFAIPQNAMETNEIEAVGNKLIAALGGAAEKKEEKQELPVPQISRPPQGEEFPTPNQSKPRKETSKKSRDGLNLDDISRILGVK
ncbi:HIT family protein [Candidatus Woesearchaeota archaeon]|nr:HIT family protein [Candidatus Woesearchaeota archaeon]